MRARAPLLFRAVQNLSPRATTNNSSGSNNGCLPSSAAPSVAVRDVDTRKPRLCQGPHRINMAFWPRGQARAGFVSPLGVGGQGNRGSRRNPGSEAEYDDCCSHPESTGSVAECSGGSGQSYAREVAVCMRARQIEWMLCDGPAGADGRLRRLDSGACMRGMVVTC